MKPSFRQVLADSHVSAVAIAILLIWSFESVLDAFWDPFLNAFSFLITAVAILGLPYIPPQLSFSQRLMLITSCSSLFNALSCFAAAWLLSRWVYGMGPVHSLKSCRKRLARRRHA
jgi:hypothetical protein